VCTLYFISVADSFINFTDRQSYDTVSLIFKKILNKNAVLNKQYFSCKQAFFTLLLLKDYRSHLLSVLTCWRYSIYKVSWRFYCCPSVRVLIWDSYYQVSSTEIKLGHWERFGSWQELANAKVCMCHSVVLQWLSAFCFGRNIIN